MDEKTKSTTDSNTSCSSADVCIIGAGMSGLMTARHLVASGRTVTVLEARDRIGGRMYSIPTPGETGLDLGATWYWSNERRVRALIKELKIPVHRQFRDGHSMIDSPNVARRAAFNAIDFDAGRYVRGAQSIPNDIQKQLPQGTVKLNHIVDRVSSAGDEPNLKLTVHTTNGHAVECDHVVVAVPPALAVQLIEFEPALPAHFMRIASKTPVWMGDIAKVVAHYSKPFWREAGLAGSARSGVGPMMEIHDMSGPDGNPAALFGFIMVRGGEKVTREEALAQFVRLFGEEAGKPEQLFIQDWSRERFTSPDGVAQLGSYQYFGHDVYHTPGMSGRLHWAATETMGEYSGHVEGALAAAEKTARVIGKK